MLLMKHPLRLSTDIDIIVNPGTNIDYYIQEASKIFPFLKCEEQIRIGKNNIEKRILNLFTNHLFATVNSIFYWMWCLQKVHMQN